MGPQGSHGAAGPAGPQGPAGNPKVSVYPASANSLVEGGPFGNHQSSFGFTLPNDGVHHAFWLHCDSPSHFAIGASYWTGPTGTEQISVPNQGQGGSAWLFNVMNTTPGGQPITIFMGAVCLKTQ